ncbi:response regulator [bacterium]|nr:response regulator [bacterium]
MAKILIVDDERDLAEILGAILKLEGHQIVSVSDGYQAIEEIKNTNYDLIMMDIRLPEMNGVETFIKIKKINPTVKVVMMTGFAVEDLIEEALDQGAYACIHKPFDLKKVIELIQKVINENKKVILIVNGDNKTREEISTALTEKGYHICTAKDSDEALAKLQDKYYHCVLLNLQSAGINGISILEEAKKLYPDIVVIVMTDYGLLEMLKDEKRLLVYAYLKKPIDIDELIKLLKDANV